MAGQDQQGTGKHGHRDTKEPYPHHEAQQGGAGQSSSGAGDGSEGESLKEREYRDSQGNVHHHTKTYEEQHGNERK